MNYIKRLHNAVNHFISQSIPYIKNRELNSLQYQIKRSKVFAQRAMGAFTLGILLSVLPKSLFAMLHPDLLLFLKISLTLIVGGGALTAIWLAERYAFKNAEQAQKNLLELSFTDVNYDDINSALRKMDISKLRKDICIINTDNTIFLNTLLSLNLITVDQIKALDDVYQINDIWVCLSPFEKSTTINSTWVTQAIPSTQLDNLIRDISLRESINTAYMQKILAGVNIPEIQIKIISQLEPIIPEHRKMINFYKHYLILHLMKKFEIPMTEQEINQFVAKMHAYQPISFEGVTLESLKEFMQTLAQLDNNSQLINELNALNVLPTDTNTDTNTINEQHTLNDNNGSQDIEDDSVEVLNRIQKYFNEKQYQSQLTL